MSDPAIWAALAASVLGCYFAACYISLKTCSRARLADVLLKIDRQDRFDLLTVKRPRLVLLTATLRTGLSLVTLLAILNYLERHHAALGIWTRDLIALVVAGATVSVLSVAVPASLARYHREWILAHSAPILNATLLLLGPVVTVLLALDPVVRRVSGGKSESHLDHAAGDEILSVVQEQQEEGAVDEDQKDMIEAVVELPTTTVGQIMTPRTEVQGVEAGADLDQVREVALSEGHSRIPVYDGDLDHITGILYVKDLIRLINGHHDHEFDLRSLLRDALMVPESKLVRELLAEFKARKVHIAIVLDEYGGTAGLVTIEDILEEIVGEISDEYEPTDDAPKLKRIDEHTVEVDARFYIDDLNDALDIDLPESGDYDTVGGFVFSTLGHIPQVGEKFEYAGTRITVTAAERTRVNRLRLEGVAAATVSQSMVRPTSGG